jgi:hypothetical protein
MALFAPRQCARFLTVLLVAALPASALAAGRVAALVPEVRPNATPELQSRFHEAVTRGLASGDLEVVPAGEVKLRLGVSDELLGCATPGPCVPRAALILRTDKVVLADVNAIGKDYTIKLLLLDGAGRELAHVDDACDICTVKEAEDALARAAARIALNARIAPVEPTSPVEKPAARPEAPLKDLKNKENEVPPAVAPAPSSSTVAGRERRPFPWRSVAIGSLAVGVVGLAIGIPLVAIDGQPTCDLPNPRRSCPEVYNTGGGGGTLVAFGAAGLAASGVLFYLDYRARHRPPAARLAVTPTVGGTLLTAGGRF